MLQSKNGGGSMSHHKWLVAAGYKDAIDTQVMDLYTWFSLIVTSVAQKKFINVGKMRDCMLQSKK